MSIRNFSFLREAINRRLYSLQITVTFHFFIFNLQSATPTEFLSHKHFNTTKMILLRSKITLDSCALFLIPCLKSHIPCFLSHISYFLSLIPFKPFKPNEHINTLSVKIITHKSLITTLLIEQ